MRLLNTASNKSLQSAMEYLTTYGWAILVIAVVLGVLFQLGVFGGTNFVPRAQPRSCRVFRAAGTANLEGVCSGQLPQYVAQFNGQNSNIVVPDSTSLQLANSFTVAAWVNYNYVPPSGISGIILWKPTTPADIKPQYDSGDIGSPTTGSQYRYYWTVAGTRYASPALPISSGTWMQIVLTYDGSTFKPYFNRVYQSSGAQSQTGPLDSSAGKPLYIGIRTVASYAPFNGFISNIQIYNTSLDANQINALYLEGIGGAPIAPQYLAGWWPLNGDASDYSGNNNNGALMNVVFIGAWTAGYTPP